MVARATVSQFEPGSYDIIRLPYITSVEQIEEVLREATAKKGCVICHTFVSENLRQSLAELAKKSGVPTIDIMGPMINAVVSASGLVPKLQPGLMHQLDQEYFKRVEAIEFAVKYDDGKNPWGLLKADMVLIGVSRTSKTPLSMYLAHKKIKVANVPLVPEVPPPPELFKVPPHKIVGMIIDPFKLNEIRSERLKVMGLSSDASYANLERIMEELEYAKAIMRKTRCVIIDVSNKAIEETANRVLEIYQKSLEKK